MFAFPSMISGAAKDAGIKVPEDPENFDREEFPHFQIFCTLQLARPMTTPNEHWENAEVIAKIPEEKIRTITAIEVAEMGFQGLRL